MLKNLQPILWTRETEATISFYTDVLGFTLNGYDKNLGWASLQRDHIVIMIGLPNEHMHFEKPVFTGSFYIHTDNVDEIWDDLKNKVKIVYDIENFEWQMREFAIYDNNGYIIQFGQDISERE